MTRSGLIDTLVAQALDDLDERRMDIENALRSIAGLAWQLGYRAARDPAGIARPAPALRPTTLLPPRRDPSE